MTSAEFKRVVVGITDIRLKRIAPEGRAKRSARSVHLAASNGEVDCVLTARSAGERSRLHLAGLAEAETQRRIPGIGLYQDALAMAGGADVVCAYDSIRSYLPLNGEHPFVGVRSAIVNVVTGNAFDRLVGAPVNAVVWILRRRVQR